MTFVLDASVSLTWLFRDGVDPEREASLGCLERLRQPFARALVPAIWPIEVANVLARAERSGGITPADRISYLELLRALPIDVDVETGSAAFGETLGLARDHGLSAYDASYLELAMRRHAPLATRDLNLAAAAARSGVDLLIARSSAP